MSWYLCLLLILEVMKAEIRHRNEATTVPTCATYYWYIMCTYCRCSQVVIIHVPLVQPDRSLHLNDSVSRKQAVFHAPWWRQIPLHLHRLYCEVFLPTLGLQRLCSSPGQRVCLSSTSWALLQHLRLHQMVYSFVQSEVDHWMRWPIQISAKWL